MAPSGPLMCVLLKVGGKPGARYLPLGPHRSRSVPGRSWACILQPRYAYGRDPLCVLSAYWAWLGACGSLIGLGCALVRCGFFRHTGFLGRPRFSLHLLPVGFCVLWRTTARRRTDTHKHTLPSTEYAPEEGIPTDITGLLCLCRFHLNQARLGVGVGGRGPTTGCPGIICPTDLSHRSQSWSQECSAQVGPCFKLAQWTGGNERRSATTRGRAGRTLPRGSHAADETAAEAKNGHRVCDLSVDATATATVWVAFSCGLWGWIESQNRGSRIAKDRTLAGSVAVPSRWVCFSSGFQTDHRPCQSRIPRRKHMRVCGFMVRKTRTIGPNRHTLGAVA